MVLQCGMDLHGKNVLCSLTDENDKIVTERRLPTQLEDVLKFLNPYRESIVDIVIESTYNWYWLVDGLQEEKYPVSLANPNAVKTYDGLKHGNDQGDARHLAHLSRLGVLPTGYIYPKEQRGLRDLLRRRMYLVQERTGLILSLQSLCERLNGGKIAAEKFKHMKPEKLAEKIDDPYHQLGAVEYLEIVRRINQSIYRLETRVLHECQDTRQFNLLITIPGVGQILAMMITLESGPMKRFAAAGNYASYARTVNADRYSDGKKKGENNRKCGNKYLAWALVQAVHHLIRHCPEARSFYDRKKAKKNGAVATKALACKLARCIYHMLTKEEAFDVKKIFG
jgi:transposase